MYDSCQPEDCCQLSTSKLQPTQDNGFKYPGRPFLIDSQLWLTIFTCQQASFVWATACRAVTVFREHTSRVKGVDF